MKRLNVNRKEINKKDYIRRSALLSDVSKHIIHESGEGGLCIIFSVVTTLSALVSMYKDSCFPVVESIVVPITVLSLILSYILYI